MFTSNLVVRGVEDKADAAVALWGSCHATPIEKLQHCAAIVAVPLYEVGPTTALRRALAALSDPEDYQEPVDARTFAVLRNVLVNGEFVAEELCRAQVVTGTAEPFPRILRSNHPRFSNVALDDAYQQAKGTYTATDIGVWLSKYAIPALRGVAMRDRGGVYLIPTGSVARWREFADTLTGTGACQCHSLPVVYGPRLASIAVESVSAHCATELQTIKDAVLSGQLGARALTGRIETALDVERTVRAYADLLGSTQQVLLADVEEVRACIEAAMIMQEASKQAKAV